MVCVLCGRPGHGVNRCSRVDSRTGCGDAGTVMVCFGDGVFCVAVRDMMLPGGHFLSISTAGLVG